MGKFLWSSIFRATRAIFDSELLARSVTAAKHFDRVVEYSRLLFAAIFHSSEPITIDERVCCICAKNCDIPIADFQATLTDRSNLERLDATIDRALNLGIFGVPTFVTRFGEIFWGNDRLILLQHYLNTSKTRQQ